MKDWSNTDLKFFRLSKFEVNRWFDGTPHLLRRGVDFPDVMANEDVIIRLRSAANYRKIRIVTTPGPDGIVVQSDRTFKDGIEEGSLADQLFQAHEQIDVLKKAVVEAYEKQDAQLNELGEQLRDLEQECSFIKEELSILKTRRQP